MIYCDVGEVKGARVMVGFGGKGGCPIRDCEGCDFDGVVSLWENAGY